MVKEGGSKSDEMLSEQVRILLAEIDTVKIAGFKIAENAYLRPIFPFAL